MKNERKVWLLGRWGNRRTQQGKEGLSVTLVAAGWMLAYALTSNLCSEATDRPSFPCWVLFVLKLQNGAFRVLMNCETAISGRRRIFWKRGKKKRSDCWRFSFKMELYTFYCCVSYCLGLRIEIVCRYFAILISTSISSSESPNHPIR